MYQITFYDPNNPLNQSIIEFEDIKMNNLKTEADINREHGRTEVKIKVGYPVKCPWCGVITDLNFLPGCIELCKDCAKKANKNRPVSIVV